MIPILILIMLQWAGPMYFYDFPQLFEPQLIKHFSVSTVEISLLYSSSSAPNLVSNLMAAWVIEKIGLGVATVIFSAQCFFGIFICFLGITLNRFELLLVGRLVFGFGYGTMFLTQTTANERWFNGKFMTLASGLCRSCVYLFAAVSSYLQPEFYFMDRGFELPFFVYAIVAFACFVTTAIFGAVHIKKKYLLETHAEKEAMKSKFSLNDFRHTGFLPWLISMNISLVSNCYYQVMNFTTDMLVKRYGMKYVAAPRAVGIRY